MRKIENGIAFAPNQNVKGNDARGAFHPKQLRWAKLHGVAQDAILRFDVLAAKVVRAMFVTGSLMRVFAARSCQRFDALVFFCHGFKTGLQAGFDLANIDKLADAIAATCTDDVVIFLAACSTARDSDKEQQDDLLAGIGGDGGFADVLRDKLAQRGLVRCVVYAHATAGHATTNPWVRVFAANGTRDPQQGGAWLYHPEEDAEGWASWRIAMTDEKDGDNLDLLFPWMDRADIANTVKGRKSSKSARQASKPSAAPPSESEA